VKTRLRAAAAHLALVLFGLLLAVLFAEIALRMVAGSAKGGKEQRERSRYTEYDPVLGWHKTPGAAVRYERRDYSSEFRVNSRGLRGPERPYEKRPGARRVLALGDSFVEAFMVPDAQTVTARLEEALAGRGCAAEVINGGSAAYSTDQEYLFYREEGRRYAPDVVVLFVYHNDIPYLVLDDYLGVPKPRLDFAAQPPSLVTQPVPADTPAPVPSPAAAAPAGTHSYLLEFVKDRLERTSASTYNRLAAWGLWEPLRKLPMNDELRLFRVPELGHLRPAWSAFTWTVETLARAVAKDGGRLVIAYVPSRMEVSEGTWELSQARYDLDPAVFDRTAVASRIRYIADRLRIPMVDLTAPLAGADNTWRPAYYPTDSHWNARGQEVAGQAVAGFLIERGVVPGCR
jgi:lysophospholipase L1-like esterase